MLWCPLGGVELLEGDYVQEEEQERRAGVGEAGVCCHSGGDTGRTQVRVMLWGGAE